MRWPRTGLEALVMTGILAMPTPGFTDAARKTQYRLTLSSTYFRDPPPQPQPQNPPSPPPQQPAPRPPYLPPEEPSSAELPGGAYYVTPSAQQSDKPAYLQPAPVLPEQQQSEKKSSDYIYGTLGLLIGVGVVYLGFHMETATVCENGACKERTFPNYPVVGSGVVLTAAGVALLIR